MPFLFKNFLSQPFLSISLPLRYFIQSHHPHEFNLLSYSNKPTSPTTITLRIFISSSQPNYLNSETNKTHVVIQGLFQTSGAWVRSSGPIFFKKQHFVCLHPVKNVIITISNKNIIFKNQATRLGAKNAPNKSLEQALKEQVFIEYESQ